MSALASSRAQLLLVQLEWIIGYASTAENERWGARLTEKLTDLRDLLSADESPSLTNALTEWNGQTFGDEAIIQGLVPHDHPGVNGVTGEPCRRCNGLRRLGHLQGIISSLHEEIRSLGNELASARREDQ